MRRQVIALGVALMMVCSLGSASQNFITANGLTFYDGTTPFYFCGANCYYLMEIAATNWDWKNTQHVDEILTLASVNGLKVIRTWAFSDAFEYAPGQHSEQWFLGLDYTLWKAQQLGLRVILSLTNNWPHTNYRGIDRYVDWSPTASSHDEFFTDANCQSMYRAHVDAVLNRANAYKSGLLYKDDPTILAWDLCNEPRTVAPGFSTVLDDWLEDTSTYVKSIDSNHLLTAGLEGFWSWRTSFYSDYSIYPQWMADGFAGSDFVINAGHDNLDFVTIHCLPDDWTVPPATMNTWTALHLNDVQTQINKPLVIEEIGVMRSSGIDVRDTTFENVFSASYYLNAAGAMIWSLYNEEYVDQYGVYASDTSTLGLMQAFSAKMNGKLGPFWNLMLAVDHVNCSDGHYSGAASIQSNLEFLGAGSHPYNTLHTEGQSFNEAANGGLNILDPTAIEALLESHAPEPYEFGIIQQDDLPTFLKYVCHWLDYEVPGASKPNVPILVPLEAGYEHWVVVCGASTDVDPKANDDLWNVGSFTVFGLVLLDSRTDAGTIGYEVFKEAAELSGLISPVVSSDVYNGKYVGVAEPPSYVAMASDPGSKALAGHREALAIQKAFEAVRVEVAPSFTSACHQQFVQSLHAKSNVVTLSTSELANLVDPRAFADPEFAEVFGGSEPQDALDVEDRSGSGDYVIVPMGAEDGSETRLAVVLDAEDGHFRECSWSVGGQRYPFVSQGDAVNLVFEGRKTLDAPASTTLIYDPDVEGCSLYYPVWEVVMGDGEMWRVTQASRILSPPTVAIRLRPPARVGRPFPLWAKCEDSDGQVVGVNWDFGDGQTLNGSSQVFHVWRRPGVYVVTCKAVDNDGLWSAETTQIVRIRRR